MAATAIAIAAEIAAKGFGTLFSELVKKVFTAGPGIASKDLPPARFRDHLNQTFERCTKMKTLISRDVSINLLDQYVHLTFSQNSKNGIDVFDDYDVIDRIKNNKRAVVLGTAGGGKTVFMRYLWISYFTTSAIQIPIFLELRRLNELSTVDLISFIFRNIITNDTSVGIESFKKYISEGKFIFIFDGFDEISEDKRLTVEKQILDLSFRHKDNIIIVSGRPDSRFDAWQEFSNYRVKPLDKKQVTELIKKIDFDLIIKNKFLDALSKTLYDKHRSFLSSPLLSTMMLLTFSHYAEIPEKIHVFYDLAFDTLFSKHDALKDAFNRKKYTNLSIDVFKRRFSFFCLLSYFDERYEFTRDDLLRYLKRSADLDGVEIDADALVRDLLETVCMLQEDGLEIIFTHRSFQEYFTAYCLVRMPTSKLSQILPKLSGRNSDSVFVMIMDMNKDLVEEAYILPSIEIAKNSFGKLSPKASAVQFANAFGIKIILEYEKMSAKTFQLDVDDSESNRLRRISEALYPTLYKPCNEKMEKFKLVDSESWKAFPLKKKLEDEISKQKRISAKGSYILIRFSINSRETDENASVHTIGSNSDRDIFNEFEIELLNIWFETTGHALWIKEHSRCFLKVMDQIPKNHKKRGQNLHEILGV